ncbi:hypothetical protein K431DRAFT_287227 [Polychaeton citri CBS 116435]|uniref:Translation initiation factor 3 N-terminal domain-containing protein n=1 Tax=Polychaeton citri CBS 116435 TaxID=1314669 RepID=A0A9P4UMJ9_9PEZI|nr:hypothetical protein K431DRAFT_287227 [Polychaeton citri CBS 116435]
MSTRAHSASCVAKTLYNVFVLPGLLNKGALQRPQHLPIRNLTCKSWHASQTRHFSCSCARLAALRVDRRPKRDEEITALRLRLIDSESNKLLPEPRTRFDLLRMYDKKTHWLIQVTPDEPGNPDFIPSCKIVSKKEEYEAEKRKKQLQKEQAKVGAKEGSTKTLELNWAIDQNDLSHRLGRISEFLSEGRKVEMVFAAKKRGRKATREECDALLGKIAKVVDTVPGAKEHKNGLQGKIGGFATLLLEGRTQQQS